MRYKLTIEKIEENPKHDPRDMYRTPTDPFVVTKVLEVDLDEKEFLAAKKAVLEVAK